MLYAALRTRGLLMPQARVALVRAQSTAAPSFMDRFKKTLGADVAELKYFRAEMNVVAFIYYIFLCYDVCVQA